MEQCEASKIYLGRLREAQSGQLEVTVCTKSKQEVTGYVSEVTDESVVISPDDSGPIAVIALIRIDVIWTYPPNE